MKALTICQPYPYLICLPEEDPRHKRVENRTWPTGYRGQLAIHAGKSRHWLEVPPGGQRDLNYDIDLKDLVFGAVVAVANLSLCVEKARLPELVRRVPSCQWIIEHPHTEGPWCWVFSNVRPLRRPLPWMGAQGLFEIPDEAINAALRAGSGMTR